MSGEPLLEAVRCAKHIIDRLESTDVVSLIMFDDRVNTLSPAKPVGDRKALYTALSHVRSGGSTNLHGGWQAGSATILEDVKQAAIARVILLSDGNANVGDTTDTNEIAALCAHAAEQGVTTSTYGLGRDFNEELMVEMGKRGEAITTTVIPQPTFSNPLPKNSISFRTFMLGMFVLPWQRQKASKSR